MFAEFARFYIRSRLATAVKVFSKRERGEDKSAVLCKGIFHVYKSFFRHSRKLFSHNSKIASRCRLVF